MKDVIVVIGPGQIGQAIARRVGIGKHVLLADVRPEQVNAAAEVMRNAGYDVSVATADISSRADVRAIAEQASRLGDITSVVLAAGISPLQGAPDAILRVNLYGTALVLDAFGQVIASGGSGVVISSQAGHQLPALGADVDRAIATTPAEALLGLPFLQPAQVTDALHAYQLSKRGVSLRVMAEAVRWGMRGARINAISPGIIMTPFARNELNGPRGGAFRQMIEATVVRRAGLPDEVAGVAALLMGSDGGYITGSDFLMDGGGTAADWYGDVAGVRGQHPTSRE